MSRLLYRIGRAAAARPWRVIGGWLAVLAIALTLSMTLGADTRDDYRVAGSPAQTGADFLDSHFAGSFGADARVVLHTGTGALQSADVEALRGRLAALPHVTVVEPAQMSADSDTALIGVRYDVPVTSFQGSEAVDALWSAAKPLQDSGFEVALGGEVPENFSPPGGTAELVGIVIALVILVIAFGSVLAAGLPLAVALVGLGIGTSLITLLAAVTDVSNTAPTVATMVGIGVGIDYALLLVTRFVEGLRRGLAVTDAAARANATAGVSVLFAGTTVLVSLLGLRLADLPAYTSMGVATLLVVTAVMATSVTLVPALCGLVGTRALRKSERALLTGSGVFAEGTQTRLTRPTMTARWAQRIGRRPWPWALAALSLLILLAAPVLGMRTWPQDAGSRPAANTTRVAYDLLAQEFGPGANGPFVVAVDLERVPAAELPGLLTRIRADAGVAGVTPPAINRAGDAAVIAVQPTTGPQDGATTVLLQRLRADLPDGVMITGLTPALADIADRLSDRLWVVIAFVVGISILLLAAVFRSVVIPLKAAALNLLSVAAAYGVMVVVFQWGWGAELLGLPHAGPISSWVPILMFAILFGLSMDYQVFLLSRIREDYLATGDPHGSVVRGLSSTGRVITSAAAIMVAVFIGFGLDADPTVKMMGVGMAVAVLIDATVVRLVLVPATMTLLGSANWWLPAWLDRMLPKLDVDGHDPAGAAQELGAEPRIPATAGAGNSS